MDISVTIIIISVVVWIQLIFFLKTAVGIRTLKNIYPSIGSLGISNEFGTQIISVHSKISKEFGAIIHATNTYLKENQGTVDFYVIQNLSE